MLNKENFLKIFPFKGEDDIIAQIYDKFSVADKSGKPIVVKTFLTPKYWLSLEAFIKGYKMPYLLEGFFQEAERRLFIFNYIYGMEVPALVLHIKNKSKFTSLRHKDYLGALLSLGIERDSIGDIVVHEDGAYVAILTDISKYVLNSLQYIGNNPCHIEVVEDMRTLPKVSKEELEVIVTSRRLDNFISSICRLSRTEAIKLIEQGKVLVDYIEVKEKSAEVKSNSTISIRGYGKFNICDTVKSTKSNRQVVVINKFI